MQHRGGKRYGAEPDLFNIDLHATGIHDIANHQYQLITSTLGFGDEIRTLFETQTIIIILQ